MHRYSGVVEHRCLGQRLWLIAQTFPSQEREREREREREQVFCGGPGVFFWHVCKLGEDHGVVGPLWRTLSLMGVYVWRFWFLDLVLVLSVDGFDVKSLRVMMYTLPVVLLRQFQEHPFKFFRVSLFRRTPTLICCC